MFFAGTVYAEETKYILHDNCINMLYNPAVVYFEDSEISVFRDSRGIVISFGIANPEDEYNQLTDKMLKNLAKIEYFLAKIKNAVIIEVRTAGDIPANLNHLKKWEISAVIAGNIEYVLCRDNTTLKNRIHSVGYGEFSPKNNTPNNGGKLLNSVDIIILCNISGE